MRIKKTVQMACLWIMVTAAGSLQAAEPLPIFADPIAGDADPIRGSKHDFTGLNHRAGVVAMGGVAFSDYGNPCVYCHLSPEEAGITPGQNLNLENSGVIEGWNRYMPATENYRLYDSGSMDNKPNSPSSISLLCLSCHDGTMAVDMILFKPAAFRNKQDAALHMRLNGAKELTSCGQCHNGTVAHDISVKVVGTGLQDEHPVSMTYGGNNWKDPDFKLPDDFQHGFNTGVKLYNGSVECATCHNLHDPSNELLLTQRRDILCATCHVK